MSRLLFDAFDVTALTEWAVYNEALLAVGQGTLDLGSDTLKVALFTGASNCANAELDNALYATLTNEYANSNGYSTGGVVVTPTLTGDESSSETILDISDPQFTASGGSIVARYAVLYDDTATGKPVIAYCQLSDEGSDVTVPDGYTLKIAQSGILGLQCN